MAVSPLSSPAAASDFQCIICQESKAVDLTTLKCKHIYHTACINEWMRKQSKCRTKDATCPLCLRIVQKRIPAFNLNDEYYGPSDESNEDEDEGADYSDIHRGVDNAFLQHPMPPAPPVALHYPIHHRPARSPLDFLLRICRFVYNLFKTFVMDPLRNLR